MSKVNSGKKLSTKKEATKKVEKKKVVAKKATTKKAVSKKIIEKVPEVTKVQEKPKQKVSFVIWVGLFIVIVVIALMIFKSFKAKMEAASENALKEEQVKIDFTKSKNLQLDTWSDDVKTAVNDFVSTYGKGGTKYEEESYAVFNFDNTCTIFDVTEQLFYYQMQNMCYTIAPENFYSIITTGVSKLDDELSVYGYKDITLGDFVSDICEDYRNLSSKYGPFTDKGVNASKKSEMLKSDDWNDYATKLMTYYYLLGDIDSIKASRLMLSYLYSGMTREQLFELSKTAMTHYKGKDFKKVTLKSSKTNTRIGNYEIQFIEGINVTDNIKELFGTLNNAGIHVWICSSSHEDVVSAATDVFDLTNSITGVIGLRNKIVGDKYANVNESYPYGKSKIEAVDESCVSQYGRTPIATFGSSTADFNLCTEYKSVKLCIVFNTADGGVTSGQGLLAEIAAFQKDSLKYNLAKANNSEDTLYVLQGRDENGKGSFRNSDKTIKFGETEEKLFYNNENKIMYDYFCRSGLNTETIINIAALAVSMENPNNGMGFDVGFLKQYDGYHSKKAPQ